MGGWNARLQDDGPITYEAVGPTIIKGGQLIVPSSNAATSDPTLGGADVCKTDAAKNVLGVAYKDALPVALRAAQESTTTASGYFATDISVPDATVVAANDVVGFFQFTTATALGDAICAADNTVAGTVRADAPGKVRKWVDGTDDPAAIIGSCQNPGGVAAGAVGLARIRTH